MKTIKVLLAALLMVGACGCTEKGLGDHVYVDNCGVIHTDKDCLKKNYLKSGNPALERLSARGVTYLPVVGITERRKVLGKLCPHCVTDHQAELLRDRYATYPKYK